MNNLLKSAGQEVEQLISKISKSNTEIISEVTKFLGQLSASKMSFNDVVSMEKKMLTDTVDMFIKLNSKYTSDLIDIAVAVSKQLNQNTVKTNGFEGGQSATAQPAFEIKTGAEAGGTASAAFLLNSSKPGTIKCNIKSSDFVSESNKDLKFTPAISFTPQSFEMNQGVPQKVESSIPVPAGTAAGVYRSHVVVEGFEDTFLDILLEVTASKTEVASPAKVAAVATAKSSTAKKAPAKKAAVKKAAEKKVAPKK